MGIDRAPRPQQALSGCIGLEVAWPATRDRLFLSSLASPVPSLFTMLKWFCFSFCPHLYTVVAPVAGWPRGWWVSGDHRGDPGYLQSASVHQSWECLWTFPPSCTVWQESRRPLCVYGLPALYSRGLVSGHLSLSLTHSNGGWPVLGCLTPTTPSCMKVGRALCVLCLLTPCS